MSLAGFTLLFGIGASRPSHDGIRRMRRTNLGQRARPQTWGSTRNTTDSPHPSSLRGHRSADRRNSPFSCRLLFCKTRYEVEHDGHHKGALRSEERRVGKEVKTW